MDDIKSLIAENIASVLDGKVTKEEILQKIEEPKDKSNGDLSYPCFNLSKILKNSPVNIANYIKENIKVSDRISKIEVVNGFLNFYLDSKNIVQNSVEKILEEKEKYGMSNEGSGKTICIDYSSPNIAKPFHLGHFRNTVLGNAIYNLYKSLGYNIVGINHLGDWGRQFGLIIEGYNRFKDEYDIEKNPLTALSQIYVRINKLAKEDEKVMDIARENFRKLESGDKEYLKLWEYFREISLKEYNRIYKILGCKFDSYNGEAFYKDKTDEVIEKLDEKKVLVESEGAKVVNVGSDIPPCIILKSDGSTIYATRDLAAILYRARTYDYTKSIYITAVDQILHFKQIFEVAKYLVDEKYQKGLVHVPYGMVRLKTGKMSTRDGNVIYINDLINDAIEKSKNIILDKNKNIEDLEKLAKQIGIGALIFNYLKNAKIKDIIFDLDETLRFDGETGPYVQYTFVRINSILKKANIDLESIKDVNYELLDKKEEIELAKLLSKYPQIIKKAASEYEPSILTRYLIDVSTYFSRFYNEYPVLVDNSKLKVARCALVYAAGIVIKSGLSILGIECPEKM